MKNSISSKIPFCKILTLCMIDNFYEKIKMALAFWGEKSVTLKYRELIRSEMKIQKRS